MGLQPQTKIDKLSRNKKRNSTLSDKFPFIKTLVLENLEFLEHEADVVQPGKSRHPTHPPTRSGGIPKPHQPAGPNPAGIAKLPHRDGHSVRYSEGCGERTPVIRPWFTGRPIAGGWKAG